MYFIAKENPKNPEGWTYLSNYEHNFENEIYRFSTSIFKNDAKIFETKEEAAKIFWIMSHYFYNYKIHLKY